MENEISREKVTVTLTRAELEKILVKNWDLLEEPTKKMLVISEVVKGGSYNGN
jgi:hypothetical protein